MLGLDVGGVLVDRVAEATDTSFFGDRPMDTPAVPGALDAIPNLLVLFGHRVHIVSKAGPKIAGLTQRWLDLRGVVGPGSIDPANVHFVRTRPEKHPICEGLEVTHFVDDRLDVLEYLTSVENRFLFTGGLGAHDAPLRVPDGIAVVGQWSRLVGLLQRDVEQAGARNARGTG